MSDWTSGWEGLRSGIAGGAELKERRTAREKANEFERQRLDVEQQRLKEDQETNKITRKIKEDELRRRLQPPPAGMLPTSVTSSPATGDQINFTAPLGPVGSQRVPGTDLQAVDTGVPGQRQLAPIGSLERFRALQGITQPQPAQQAPADSFGTGLNVSPFGSPGVGIQPPALAHPAGPVHPSVDQLFPAAGPASIGTRLTFHDGQPTLEPGFGGLTPEQQAALNENPALATQVPSFYQDLAKRHVEHYQGKIKELQEVVHKTPPLEYYLGAGDIPGVGQQASSLNALVEQYRDPKTGKIDYSKVSPSEAFSILFAEGKINDAKAVLRESELHAIEGQAALWDIVKNKPREVLEGKKYPPKLLEHIHTTVKEKAAAAKAKAMQQLPALAAEAKANGIPLERLVRDPELVGEYKIWESAPRINSEAEWKDFLAKNPPGTPFVDSTGILKTRP